MPTWFKVDGDVTALVGSGNVRGMTGVQVHFDMMLEEGDLLRMAGSLRPAILVVPKRITGHVRSDGRMYDTESVSATPYDLEDPGELGVELPANVGLNLDGDLWYRVTLFDPNTRVYRGFDHHVSYLKAPTASTVVNLADHVNLPGGVPAVGDTADVPPTIHGGNAFETGDLVGGGGA